MTNFTDIPVEEKQAALAELRSIREQFAARGWFPANSGSLSLRVGDFFPDHFYLAITEGSQVKLHKPSEGFLFVDHTGAPCEVTALKPCDETIIHTKIYRMTGCRAIFHVHTVFNSLLSEFYGDRGFVPADGIELIKALGIWQENTSIQVQVLPNYADLSSVSRLISSALNPEIPGILLRNHGIYAWGATAYEAKRHLEAFEFIFEVLYRSLLLPPKA